MATQDGLTAGQIVTTALVDSLAAELIRSDLVNSDDLADRIEQTAEAHDPNSRRVLRAFAQSLRDRAPPELTLIRGGLAQAASAPECLSDRPTTPAPSDD